MSSCITVLAVANCARPGDDSYGVDINNIYDCLMGIKARDYPVNIIQLGVSIVN
jgi:hypothetical protein